MSDVLFTNEELDELSDDTKFMRPDRCVILREVSGRDKTGAEAVTLQARPGHPNLTNNEWHCRMQAPIRIMTEYEIAGQQQPIVVYDCFLDRQALVTASDKIQHKGHIYEIAGSPGAETFYAEQRVECTLNTDAAF
jgi:hypothetical protein